MGIINRFLCFVFSAAVLVVAVAFLLVVCGIVSEDVFYNNLKYLLRQKEAPAVVGTFILFAFYFGCVSFFSKGSKKPEEPKEFLLNKTEGGQINVTVDAVKDLIERTAMTVSGVREVTSEVKQESETAIAVKINIGVLTGINVPQTANEIIAAVKSELNAALSIENAKVTISTTEISNNGASKRVF